MKFVDDVDNFSSLYLSSIAVKLNYVLLGVKEIKSVTPYIPSFLSCCSLTIRRFWGKGEKWKRKSPVGRPDTQANLVETYCTVKAFTDLYPEPDSDWSAISYVSVIGVSISTLTDMFGANV